MEPSVEDHQETEAATIDDDISLSHIRLKGKKKKGMNCQDFQRIMVQQVSKLKQLEENADRINKMRRTKKGKPQPKKEEMTIADAEEFDEPENGRRSILSPAVSAMMSIDRRNKAFVHKYTPKFKQRAESSLISEYLQT